MRSEHDSMGEMFVPDDVRYGASAQRAVLNFPVSSHFMPPPFLRGLARVKYACAKANEELGLLTRQKSTPILEAARELMVEDYPDDFPVDVFQTGSGTSTNMNMNEVLAYRATELAGAGGQLLAPIHPNDDVNLGQSSNDIMPTALHVSVALALRDDLRTALELLQRELGDRVRDFSTVLTVGRTHLMDATPMMLGQAFSGYLAQVSKAITRIDSAIAALSELAVGGTAVGTGLNTHPDFSRRVCATLSTQTGIHFVEAKNHFEAQSARDAAVEVAGLLSTVAASLAKIAHDVRLLGSGPRTGFAELRLPAVQPGSSMMPGKVNPVHCEMLVQVCLYAQGMSQVVVACAREGQLQLNTSLPLLAYALHDSVRCLASATRIFGSVCIRGLTADVERCSYHAHRSLMRVSVLAPILGYDKASAVAKVALETNRSLREVVLEMGLMEPAELDRVLGPLTMTG